MNSKEIVLETLHFKSWFHSPYGPGDIEFRWHATCTEGLRFESDSRP